MTKRDKVENDASIDLC